MEFSVKSQRILKGLGVLTALERGDALVLTGATYKLRKEPGTHIRLAFLRDPDERLCVGYASDAGGTWEPVESEPFSLRTLGYYERRVKRIGDFVESGNRRASR